MHLFRGIALGSAALERLGLLPRLTQWLNSASPTVSAALLLPMFFVGDALEGW